jgi:hypothetical protein
MSIEVSIELVLEPLAAFNTIVEELSSALADLGMRFIFGPSGCVTEGETEVGRVLSWRPGREILFEWHQGWKPDEVTTVEL